MASIPKEMDYIFITEPSDSLKCIICLELARDPKQCEDCGKLFCSECIDFYGKNPCPNCRIEIPRYFRDQRGARDIKELEVRCNSVERGCEWTGTIGTLNNHLSTCWYALVPCPNKCKDGGELTFMRIDLDNHLKEKCPNRLHQCQHCGVKRTYASITQYHDKVCDKKRVPCPNMERGCLLFVERGKIKHHVKNVCDYTEIACAYENLGCGVRMLRKDIKDHEEKDDRTHLHLSLRTVSKLTEQQKTLSEGEAVVFKIPRYSNMKEKKETFQCQPFYTHSGGYKMCIVVDSNGFGAGAGTHVSIATKLLDGNYDHHLQWPFMGEVTYELLNQLEDDRHHRRVSIFDISNNILAGGSKGISKFLSHYTLINGPATNTQYIHDDTLYFRVSVTVASHKPWLVCTDKINSKFTSAKTDCKTLKCGQPMIFKVTDYNDKKLRNATICSDSFYTGPGGYKLFIGVDPNGSGPGEGTHMSVYVELSEGNYDASLSWPFVGVVDIMLLNQLADLNHHSLSLHYEGDEYGETGMPWGYSEFISHSALSGDLFTQYLKDDTLYFKVTVKVKDHKPWLVCTNYT